MVEISLTYDGELRTRAVHGPSGTGLITDAPVDNHGKGESFSPTDLLATALGSCMLTYVGLTANKHGWDVRGTSVTVHKEMVADPIRRIGRLTVQIHIPLALTDQELALIEQAVITCPVKESISDRIQVPLTITCMPTINLPGARRGS
ncbi:MAG: OsmC family protein [Candidatus Kapabacteria bacterium]|nr:OsmC family protein [Candidatus Kapabacteria bacterium]